MSIPLYLGVNCKESVTLPGAQAVSIGCGMTKNGELRRGKSFWSGTPLLIDDAVMALPTEKCWSEIRSLCAKGCILDFERSPGTFHSRFIQRLTEIKIAPLWLPEAYAAFAPKGIVLLSHSLPHNSWRQFCSGLNTRYPQRWALELQPVKCEKKLPQKQPQREFFLREAICQCKIRDDRILYYDTAQTLLQKLKIAESYGCQGGIALWTEWPK